MGWGGGWGNHSPETARTVAKAFREAAYCKRGNCYTEDGAYILENSVIAKGLLPGCEHVNTRRVLEGLEPLEPVKYSFRSWPTKMTARHLSALGIRAECWGIKNPRCFMNGREVSQSGWYTLAQIEELPLPEPKKVKPPPPPPEPDRQLPLFPELCAA